MAADFDLVVVGAGAAGLLAAVAARRLGSSVLVVDADPLAGGSTAISDGRVWLPGNHLAAKLAPDSTADADIYVEALLGETTPASSAARRGAFTRTAPKLARWLTSSNVPLAVVRGLPDHHPDLPGGRTQGRVLAPHSLDRRVLGPWEESLRTSGERPGGLGRFLPGSHATRTAGEALAVHLLHRATANGVDVWLDSPVVDLLISGEAVSGVVVRHDGADHSVTAGRVLLASGGFEHDQGLREEYLPLPTDQAWSTSGADHNTGDLLKLATARGAAAAELDEAWWTPVMLAEGRAWSLDEVRGRPHCLIVDAAGDRFFDESLPANTAGRALYERSRGMRAVPSFLIMDNRHRQSVELGPWAAGSTPRKAIESGEIVRAHTLNDLAQSLGVDRAGLLGTAVRFNGFAAKGKDLDFSRGESAWAASTRETGKRRTPAKVDKPPFWAVKVYPGDRGTKGGLLIDERSRVLRTDGSALDGLYACGGAAASIFKGTSPGPGAALGAALVEAFLAATDQPRP
ncbi:FAD-dependent oxidoreductase [Propionicimonas sp.]|uniref:FAD-dependent oxidoreductase n=1 Tax=Propionicimonas sp. TaxID=1955623 RepID=UPI0039E424C4